MKFKLLLSTGLLVIGLESAIAADVTLGAVTPSVGDGVQNLNFSTDDASNTAHDFVPGDYIGSEYRNANFGNTLEMGQSFTTGAGTGFLLNSISVRQVSWGPTDWDFDGGSVTLRVFDVSGGLSPAVEMVYETAAAPAAATSPTIGGTPGAPTWLTFGLTDPLPLSANSQYAFTISATGGTTNEEFFMNLDGTATDSYAGGTSITVDNTDFLWNGGGGSDRAFVANMSLPTSVTFSLQPGDVDGSVGDAVTLTSTAIGDPEPTYQWEYSPDGFDPWDELTGETASDLTLDPATYADNGWYRVVATNTFGSETSNEVLVDLIYPEPVISVQPMSDEVIGGDTASLSVTATSAAGGTVTYQWYKIDGGGDIMLVDGGDISGATGSNLQIANMEAADEGDYYVRVFDDAGELDTGFPAEIDSDTATLSVLVAIANATVGSATPAVGDGVQNLSFSTDDASNTQHQFVPGDFIGSEYRAANFGETLQMAQSFTTGSNAGGYELNSISVRQVSWGPTDWDLDGGIVTLRIFDLSAGGGPVWVATELAAENAVVTGGGSPTIGGTPAPPQWLTITLSSPVSLSANTLYAFAVSATGGVANEEFFMNLDGTATDSYPGGFSLSVDETNSLFDGNNGQPSDRAFVANMTSGAGADDFAGWIGAYPGVGAMTGFTQDPDFDGKSSGLESFFGTDPSEPTPGISEATRTGVNTFTFQHPQNPALPSDVTAAYRWSLNFGSWFADGEASGGTTVDFSASPDTPVAGTTTVTATISGTVPPEIFAGVEVIKSDP